jgi:hypothetical protein
MNKHITLSLLIFSSTFAHAMEKEFSLLNPFSWFSSNQTPNESKLITDLRANINDFENQLQLDEWIIIWQKFNVNTNPVKFIQYCYYQECHEDESINLDEIFTDASLLKTYQEMRINGCSALGAAMLAKKRSIEERREFIQKLIKYGFKPTPKDMGIAELVLHDAIGEHKQIFLILLNPKQCVFPLDIGKQIAHYMVELFKNDFWLLQKNDLLYYLLKINWDVLGPVLKKQGRF